MLSPGDERNSVSGLVASTLNQLSHLTGPTLNFFKVTLKLTQTCNPKTWETDQEISPQIPGQSGLYNETLTYKQKFLKWSPHKDSYYFQCDF